MPYLEGLAYIEEKTRTDPHYWQELARRLQDERYIFSFETAIFSLNRTGAVKEEIIDLITRNSELDMDLKFATYRFSDHDYEFAFYDNNRIPESDVAKEIERRWELNFQS